MSTMSTMNTMNTMSTMSTNGNIQTAAVQPSIQESTEEDNVQVDVDVSGNTRSATSPLSDDLENRSSTSSEEDVLAGEEAEAAARALAEVEEKRRAIWGPILDIKMRQLKFLTEAFMDRPMSHIVGVSTKSGLNNRVSIIQYKDGHKICVRVPACGWGSKWTDKDRQQLHHTANMMKFITKNTSILVPHILHFDTEFDNAISAPYIAMEFVEGVEPLDAWYGKGSAEGGMYWVSTETSDAIDNPETHDYLCVVDFRAHLPTLEQKRQTMLKSLAQHMAELRKFSFNMCGSPVFSGDGQHIVDIGPRFVEHFGFGARPDRMADHKVEEEPAVSNVKSFLKETAHDWYIERREELEEELEENDATTEQRDIVFGKHHGYSCFLDLLISCLPDSIPKDCGVHMDSIAAEHVAVMSEAPADGDEADTCLEPFQTSLTSGEVANTPARSKNSTMPFVLAPPDFGSQNILVNQDTGVITAIIDWDRTETHPRYLGWAALPDWLMHDYWGTKFYHYPCEGKTMHAHEYDRYRKDYAKYLRLASQADGMIDWKYTEKGAIFNQLLNGIRTSDTDMIYRTIDLILDGIFPRANKERFLMDTMTDSVREPGFQQMLEARIKLYLGLVEENEVRGMI